MPVFISLRLREEGSFRLILPFQEPPPGPPAGLLLLPWSSSQSQLLCIPRCVQGTAGFYNRSVVRVGPDLPHLHGGPGRPQGSAGLDTALHHTHRQGTRRNRSWDTRQDGPAALQSRPWGGQGDVPKDQQGGCFACQSPPPAVQTVFAEHILASAVHLS